MEAQTSHQNGCHGHEIDPGLFLLVFTLFSSRVIAINARGNGPCYEATGENQKEATCCRNPLSSMTGRWRRRRRSTGLGPLGLTVSVAAFGDTGVALHPG